MVFSYQCLLQLSKVKGSPKTYGFEEIELKVQVPQGCFFKKLDIIIISIGGPGGVFPNSLVNIFSHGPAFRTAT